MTKLTWQELITDKRSRQQQSIPKDWVITSPPDTVLDVSNIPEECGLLTAKDIEITLSEVSTLLSKLASGKWSSVEVTTAFYKRAVIAHQVVNCLTEIFVEKALARAAELDARLKATGQPVGPLHGLPISLKDQLRIKGLETTMGYASWIGQYAERDSALVEILVDNGAVPFVQTNVPQTLMWVETYNRVFGRTVNPHNRKLTCGGSSGGEGALLALRGSPLGVGTDIGGSVRVPSGLCGTYGFRPSYGRIPYAGTRNSLEGQDSVLSVVGPLSNSLEGLKIFMKTVIDSKPWLKDPLARRNKWDEEGYALVDHNGGKQLCFAIMWDDGSVVPHPPVIRALEMTKAALLATGHKVIDWTPHKHRELTSTVYSIWASGDSEDFKAAIAATGEPILQTMSVEDESSEIVDDKSEGEKISAYQLWQLHKRKTELRQEYLEHWNATEATTGTGRSVDAVIAPVAPYAAPPHGQNSYSAYTVIWNALDYPACVFPVTKVDSRQDMKKPAHEFLNKKDKAIYELYDPDTFWNAPVGLQLVGCAQEEEAVLAMTEIVDSALKSHKHSAKL